MNTRFYNARILDKGLFRIIQGELHVVGNRIAYIGPEKTQDAYGENAWDREIDVKENLLIPGFKDAHTHSAMTFLRSFADDLPLLDWLNNSSFPMEAKLVPEDVYSFCPKLGDPGSILPVGSLLTLICIFYPVADRKGKCRLWIPYSSGISYE